MLVASCERHRRALAPRVYGVSTSLARESRVGPAARAGDGAGDREGGGRLIRRSEPSMKSVFEMERPH
jgi:hypothetical protein